MLGYPIPRKKSQSRDIEIPWDFQIWDFYPGIRDPGKIPSRCHLCFQVVPGIFLLALTLQSDWLDGYWQVLSTEGRYHRRKDMFNLYGKIMPI